LIHFRSLNSVVWLFEQCFLEYFSRLFFWSYGEADPIARFREISPQSLVKTFQEKHFFILKHIFILFRSLNSVLWLFEQCILEYFSRLFFSLYFEADPIASFREISPQSLVKTFKEKQFFILKHILILFRSLNSVLWLFEKRILENVSRLFFWSYFEADPIAGFREISPQSLVKKFLEKHYCRHIVILFRSLNSVVWLFEQCFLEVVSRLFFWSYCEAVTIARFREISAQSLVKTF
jgi:hypothetical protein